MNRTALVVLVVLTALTATPWVASATLETITVTVLDSLGNKVPVPVRIEVYSQNVASSDSTRLESKVFPTGSGTADLRVEADFDNSEKVDLDDFFGFADVFGERLSSTNALFNLDGDSEIGFGDFFRFANQFGQTKDKTTFTVEVSSPDSLFNPTNIRFVGSPGSGITLTVEVKYILLTLTASISGDTSRIYQGDTLLVRDVVKKTFYDNTLARTDSLSAFALTPDRGLRAIGGNAVVADSVGTFRLLVQDLQEAMLATTIVVRVQPLRQVLLILDNQSIAFGDTTQAAGLIQFFRADTVLVSESRVPPDSLKITIGLKTSGHLIIGDQVGTFHGTAEYSGLTAQFDLTVKPPPDSTPPTIRLAVDVPNNKVNLAVNDSSGQVTVKATQDGTSLLSGTFTKLDTSLAVSLRDLSQPVFRVTASDKYGNAANKDTTVSVPDRTTPYVKIRTSDAAISQDGSFHSKIFAWDGGSGIDINGRPLTVTMRLADGTAKSATTILYLGSSGSDTLEVFGDLGGLLANNSGSDRKVTITAQVTDRAGNTGTDSIVLTQTGTPPPPPPPPPSDTTPPSVSISAPAGNATVSGTITVSANASDDRGVSGVQLKLDGNNLGSEITSGSYSVQLDTKTLSNGPHSVTATARDAAGNSATSSTVNFTVLNTVAPSITAATASRGGQSFASGSTFSATVGQPITFTVTATGTPTPTVAITYSDNNGVSWNPAGNPFSPTKAAAYRFRATASNGVAPDAVATWTAAVQGGAP